MNKQQLSGSVPQRTAVPFEKMVNASVENSRLDARLRLAPGEAEDGALVEKLQPLLRHGETLLSFHGRSGLNAGQCREFTIERISKHLLLQEANDRETDSKMFHA
jgi:hypothetical protein